MKRGARTFGLVVVEHDRAHANPPQRGIRARRANGCFERLAGLIGRDLPLPGEGLWLEPCAAVHTFGVRGAIDLVFVSSCMRVCRVDSCVPPRRMRIAPRCRSVLELRAGEATRLGLRPGVRLRWCPCPTEAVR